MKFGRLIFIGAAIAVVAACGALRDYHAANPDFGSSMPPYERIQFASQFSAESLVNGEGSSSVSNAEPEAAAEPSLPAEADAPPPPPPPPAPPPAPPNIESVMLPPIPQAEVNAQLADVGFTKSKAKGNGDCYPLSAVAGFEISATAARQPCLLIVGRGRCSSCELSGVVRGHLHCSAYTSV